MSQNYEDATTSVPPPIPSPKAAPQKATRLYPVLSLLSVILLFFSAGAGIALSAVVLFQNLESTEVLDPLSRAVFFVASCMSLVYVFTHLVAARTTYIENYGSPTIYGKYVAGFAFLLARLGLPVWVAAITLSIFVAVNIGLDLSKGVQDNLPWLNVIISISSLFSLAAVLAVIEMADRPFATLGLSQTWFILGEEPLACPSDGDLEPGVVNMTLTPHEKRETGVEKNSTPRKPEKQKLRTLTKRNPHDTEHKSLRHARSMSMPTPLNTVFGNRPGGITPNSPFLISEFAWKPPTRDGATPKTSGAVTVGDWVTWREHASMQQGGSDISTNASARPDEIILPSMPPHIEYSSLSQALLVEQGRSSRHGLGNISDDHPTLPHIATLATRPGGIASSIRPDSNVLPNEGRRRRRTSSISSYEGRRLTHRTEGRVTSQHSSRPGTRPSSHHPSVATPCPRPASPALTIRSVKSDVHNFSRPRTSAAARMQSKVAKRLRAFKQQEIESARQPQAEEQIPTSPVTPVSPATPRTVRAAAVKTLQDRLGKRNQKRQLEEKPRPATPETPRTARATAVKNLQERLGKRMMRRIEAEVAEVAQ
ncbi:hypothetical protein CORC01_11699 [Colletotrichum orchidophilum]|uniref:Uncharacterized protein n=1 Tax=Colletotrichum orchidophilum TaxID=1209926 RepID=A0A1G4AV51_9PEZI|nr:uncharacterized protein CORC01_11699 [Colletotrichum orchidophilum]OHE92976.1 hypothetical protein CORC01_11699 [Colletotrichum orchidophilum]